MKSWNVEICDTTLRDGEQTPGVSFTCEEKQSIAQKLDEIGVEVIEAGFPSVSPYEKDCVASISRMGLDARICCLARARTGDIEAAIDCDVDMVSIFIATSDLHIKHKFRKPREEVLAGALEMIDLARDHGMQIRFAAEDASRTEISFLKEFYRAGEERGAELLSFADIVSSVKKPLCAHCHNDMGCATANTITAAEAGAFQLHTTVNGIGERAGNAALEEVLVILRMKGGIDRYDLSHLHGLSQLVETCSGIHLQKTKPVVGEHAFSHESGIHIAAILEDPRTYEYFMPEMVGGERQFILGKHTGKKALEHVVATLGYQLNEQQICKVLDEVKELGESKIGITPETLTALIRHARKEP
jgi:methanogen homocitrate synthase